MAGDGPGGTPFESMSHEQMLAWLDQAKSGEVQAAADRLTAAAEEIRKIAGELKVRPQYVAWKGEGADAFRTWAADLANSTLRLGDFSEGAGKWLTQASGAIATAQASIPRDTKGARANLDAARAAHNDPDSATVSAKARGELAALKADQEKVRLEAAAQMRKLGQTYELSATQLNVLERPKFPPPPKVVQPPIAHASEDVTRPGGTTSGTARGDSSGSAGVGTIGVTHGRPVTSGGLEKSPSTSPVLPQQADNLSPRPPVIEPVTHLGIDSVEVGPEVHRPPADVPGGVSAVSHPNTEVPPAANGVVPPSGGSSPLRVPVPSGGQGRPALGGRLPAQLGQRAADTVPGRGVTGPGAAPNRGLPGSGAPVGGRTLPGQGMTSGRGVPANSGITGGRPATTSGTGRPVGRLPGGTVVGGEPANSRDSVGGRSASGPRGQSVAGSSQPTAGRVMSSPRDGITGGRVRQTGRTPARPGTPVPSAPTRGGVSGGVPGEAGTRRAAAGEAGGARQRRRKQQSDRHGEPPAEER
jgi:hypothetical protein